MSCQSHPSQPTSQDDLKHLCSYLKELKQVRTHLRWLRFLCWLERMPILIKTGALHSFIAMLHFVFYPTPGTSPVSRATIWLTSFIIVMLVVYASTHRFHRRSTQRAHWVRS
jgi:hypothetical protein